MIALKYSMGVHDSISYKYSMGVIIFKYSMGRVLSWVLMILVLSIQHGY